MTAHKTPVYFECGSGDDCWLGSMAPGFFAESMVPGRHLTGKDAAWCANRHRAREAERDFVKAQDASAAAERALAEAQAHAALSLRDALARAVEGAFADDAIDKEMYLLDPLYHTIVYEIRRCREEHRR